MRGKRETPSERAFAAKHCDNPRAIAKYLNDALATGDSVLITKAISDMVRAHGVTRGLRRPFSPAFSGWLYPLIPWRVGAEESGAAKYGSMASAAPSPI